MFNSRGRFHFILILLSLITVLLFQNCSSSDIFKTMSSADSSSSQDKSTVVGNGGGYDGKPEGYVRLVPGLVCENNQVAIGSLELLANSALVVTTDNSCQRNTKEVPFSDLEFSSFSKKYIGYSGGVYTYFENKQDSIDKKIFTEAWCRAFSATDKTKSDLEIAIEWQESGKIAKMSVFTQQSPTPKIMEVNRNIDVGRVIYSRGGIDGFLKINTETKIPGSLKSAGYYSGLINGEYQKISVECLMGGQFDIIAPEFSYPVATERTLVVGESLTDLVPKINKEVVSYSLEGSLPEGLVFNVENGSVSGVPQKVSARKRYSVTAKFKFGEISKALSIGVGKMVIVDQSTLDPSTSMNCAQQSAGCDLAGVVALANQIAPVPLIAKMNVAKILLAGSELSLSGDLSLIGPQTKTELNAQQLSRHFNLLALSYLELRNLKLLNGKADFGGSIKMEKATLSVKDTLFANNYADDGISEGQGGAIFSNQSFLEVFNSEFYMNKTRPAGSSIEGGAIVLSGSEKVVISKTVFKENNSASGGAIALKNPKFGSLAIFSDNVFISNTAFKGGALNILSADFLIKNNQFIRNKSLFDGGAMYVLWSDNGWIYDSVFDGNQGAGFGSAAIMWNGTYSAFNFGDSSSLAILNTTFINHQRSSIGTAGGVLSIHMGRVSLKESTFKDNSTLVNCYAVFGTTNTEFVSLGGNFSSDDSCPQ